MANVCLVSAESGDPGLLARKGFRVACEVKATTDAQQEVDDSSRHSRLEQVEAIR